LALDTVPAFTEPVLPPQEALVTEHALIVMATGAVIVSEQVKVVQLLCAVKV
jgi:hypothetical protein